MINIVGPSGAARRASVAPRAAATGFRVPDDHDGRATAAGETPSPAGVGLLALQEDLPGRRDQKAREGAEELVAELSALHRALLSGESGEPVLARAESVLAAMPPAHDPALAALQRQITLRVRVEQARRGR